MYTNSTLGEADAERHVWYAPQQRRLAEARDASGQHDEASLCGERRAVVNPPASDRLVPIREYNVGTLAEFLANPDTCDQCRERVVEDTGFEWDDYDGEFTFEDAHTLEEPDEVVEQFHQEGTEQVRSQWYDEAEDEDSQALQKALNAALGRVRINSYGKPMHLFLRGRGDSAVCGERLEAVPLPEGIAEQQQGLFDARENYDTLGALLEDWLPGGNSMYCTECAEGLADQTDTLRGFKKDALLRFAKGHQRAQEAE